MSTATTIMQRLTVAGAVGAAGVASLNAYAIDFDTVALTGEPAPDASSGVTYTGFVAPTVNASGRVAYLASTSDSSFGIWSNATLVTPTLQRVAVTGDSSQGLGGTMANFSNPILGITGDLLYQGRTSNGDGGVWRYSTSGTSLVAGEGQTLSAPDSDRTLSGIGGISFFGGDRYGFNGSHTGPQPGIPPEFGFTNTVDVTFEGTSTFGITIVARPGDSAPDAAPATTFTESSFGRPLRTATGMTLHGSTLDGREGIWTGDEGGLSLVAIEGGTASVVGGGVTIAQISPYVSGANNAGQVAFEGRLTGTGITSANEEAYFVGEAGGVAQVKVQNGEVISGLAPSLFSGVTSSAISIGQNDIHLNGQGELAFNVGFDALNVPGLGETAILTTLGSGLEVVARTGVMAAGTESGTRFNALDSTDLVFNDLGHVVFQSSLTGDAVDGSNNFGVWAYVDGELHRVIRKGESIDVLTGSGVEQRTVAQISMLTESGGQDGLATSLADNGTLALQLGFSDGSSGIFTADLTAVPEPTSLTLLAIGGSGLLIRRRRAS